jgi:hypothetical protein
MGYRSEIVYEICFYDPENPERAYADYHKFAKMLTTDSRFKDIAAGLGQEDSDGRFYMNDEKQSLCMYADQIKWYETYEWVSQHVRLLEVVSDMDEFPTANYIFLRLGENDDDVEQDVHGTWVYEAVEVVLKRVIDWDSPSRESQYNLREKADE